MGKGILLGEAAFAAAVPFFFASQGFHRGAKCYYSLGLEEEHPPIGCPEVEDIGSLIVV